MLTDILRVKQEQRENWESERMKTLGLLEATVFVLAAATSAAAQQDVMANLFGNTVIAKGALAETHTTYTRDHHFVMNVPAFGLQFKGTWARTGDQICREFDMPPPNLTNPLCTPAQSHEVGDSWTTTINGKVETVSLAKGVQ